MIKLVNINSVKPSSYNPRKADPRRLKLTELSLKKLGFLLPIYADANGEILSGHQRHFVAKKLGVKKIPVVFLQEMALEKRKALNILFNRSTNDFNQDDTSKTVTEKLSHHNLFNIAKTINDIKINTDEFYPCMNIENISVKKLISTNRGRWNKYCRNVAAALYVKKILLPIITTHDLKIINGIGRLEIAAEKKLSTVQIIKITPAKALLAQILLNFLSMDFDIHIKYEDLLRYNSFRRAYTNRAGLGLGFYIGAFGNIRSKNFKLTSQTILKWKSYYGNKILDFGAGHLTDTTILSAAGIEVTPFEPFKIAPGTNSIDKEESLKLTKKFIQLIKENYQWESIFISSVLNSVPFIEDRKKIVWVLAALSSPKTVVHAWTMSTKHKSFYSVETQPLSKTDTKQIRFKLDYESGIILGNFSNKPKVQKYHTPREIKELFSIAFNKVNIKVTDDSILAECSNPKRNSLAIKKAIEFEFNLPYPDGSTMNLSKSALKAFKQRGVI